ncbi:MAG TPA: hypothetical protein VFU16_08375 [Solirubrobacterales bacterium]|nr:hypothetical protein [Solirubrobacterales bacterium]
MKRLGPELKLPKLRSRSGSAGDGGLKPPAFLTDLYQDLRDRRLLPLVVLLLVGIVAAPILLGGGSSEPEEEAAPPPPAASAPVAAGKSLTVVEAHPGLRAPSKRLAGRTPNNPFTQRYTGSVREGGLPNENATATSSTATSNSVEGGSTSVVPGGTTASSGSPPPSSSAPESPGGSSDGEISGGKLYTFTVDVQLSRTEVQPDGSRKMGEPSVRKGVKPPAPLPGEKAPVVTYLGVNFVKSKPRALLMVSRDVSAVFGDAKCVSGTSSCELLEVEPGFPEIFEYGPNEIRYKLTVLKIEIANDGNF